MAPTIHPAASALGGFVGSWSGGGTGQLPGGDPFTWTEQLEVGHAGTPALWFRQRTRRPDGSPFHAEDGWVRTPPELQGVDGAGTRVELAVASPTGIVEVLDGVVTVDGGTTTLDATSTSVARTAAAGLVLSTRRRWQAVDDELRVDFWMATPAHPTRFHHLTGRFVRDDVAAAVPSPGTSVPVATKDTP